MGKYCPCDGCKKSAAWRKRVVLAKSGCLYCVPKLQIYKDTCKLGQNQKQRDQCGLGIWGLIPFLFCLVLKANCIDHLAGKVFTSSSLLASHSSTEKSLNWGQYIFAWKCIHLNTSAPIVHLNSETAHGFGVENYPLFFLISKKEKGVLCKKRITVFCFFFVCFPFTQT